MVAVGFSKIVVITVNIIFMIFGLAILTIGIIFKVGWDDVRDAFVDKADKVDFDLQTAGDAAGVSAISLGALMLIIAVFGCAGACCKNRCMLGTYGVIVLLVLIAQIGIVSYVAVKGNDAEDNLQEGLVESLKDYNETSTGGLSKSWSAIFHIGDCCAITNYTADFKTNPFEEDTKLRTAAGIKGNTIPITCCRGVDYEDKLTTKIFTDHKQCLENPDSKNAYTKGCYSTIKDWIDDHKSVLIGVGCGVLIFELILIIMAFFLCSRADD